MSFGVQVAPASGTGTGGTGDRGNMLGDRELEVRLAGMDGMDIDMDRDPIDMQDTADSELSNRFRAGNIAGKKGKGKFPPSSPFSSPIFSLAFSNDKG
jgi:hypothetical protein